MSRLPNGSAAPLCLFGALVLFLYTEPSTANQVGGIIFTTLVMYESKFAGSQRLQTLLSLVLLAACGLYGLHDSYPELVIITLLVIASITIFTQGHWLSKPLKARQLAGCCISFCLIILALDFFNHSVLPGAVLSAACIGGLMQALGYRGRKAWQILRPYAMVAVFSAIILILSPLYSFR